MEMKYIANFVPMVITLDFTLPSIPSHQGREANPSSLLPLSKGRMGGVNPSPLVGEG
jgi:hypothetical protein